MGREVSISEPFAVTEVYLDGVEHMVIGDMMMATGYRIMPPCHEHGEPQRIAVIRFVIKVENVVRSMADAKKALSMPVVLSERDRLGRH